VKSLFIGKSEELERMNEFDESDGSLLSEDGSSLHEPE
jgi:hypothetical protein